MSNASCFQYAIENCPGPSPELPMTGFVVLFVILLGLGLLAGGIMLRRRT